MRPERCTEVLGAGARDSAEHKTRPGSRGTEALEITGLTLEGTVRPGTRGIVGINRSGVVVFGFSP